MAKVNAKELIKRIKEREKDELKANYTFRLPKRLMTEFKAKCEREDVSMATVIHELIANFNDN